MNLQKFRPFESKKYRQAASGQSCVRCGTDDGTVMLRHYNGMRQQALGKGRGIKCTDVAGADLCSKCDAGLTEGGASKDIGERIEWSEAFLFYCLLTVHRRVTDGVLK